MTFRLPLVSLLPVLFLTALTALAGDAWDKVKTLPTGSDLKIYELGSAQPKIAKYQVFTSGRSRFSDISCQLPGGRIADSRMARS